MNDKFRISAEWAYSHATAEGHAVNVDLDGHTCSHHCS